MPHPNPLIGQLESLLGHELLLDLARKSGFLRRDRDLQVVPFFWTLVLGMIASPQKSVAGLQRLYHELTGTVLASSSFQERFNAGLVTWLKAAFEHAAAAVGENGRQMRGALASFVEVTLIDSTILRLHKLLAGRYPGPRTNHSPAALKLNLAINVKQGRIYKAQIAEGTKAETKLFSPGAWVAGHLLLFDLGYFKLQKFWQIDHHKGFFISRLKDNCNPTIVCVLSTHRGRAIDLAGKKLKDVLGLIQREVLDCEIVYRVTRKGLPGRPAKEKTVELKLRLVAVLNKETGKYHIYVTNVWPDRMEATDVAETYRLRWFVEIFMKELRTVGGLDDWPNRKEPAVLAGIYATLLGMVVNRRLLMDLEATLKAQPDGGTRYIPSLRWSLVFAAHARLFLDLILDRVHHEHRQILSIIAMLLAEAAAPKRRKARLEARIAG